MNPPESRAKEPSFLSERAAGGAFFAEPLLDADQAVRRVGDDRMNSNPLVDQASRKDARSPGRIVTSGMNCSRLLLLVESDSFS
jgi:hypothetical protein